MRARLRFLLVIALLVAPSSAAARREREVQYRFNQVWSSAVRLLRVEMRFPIEDRDEQNGFLLFEYRDPQGRTYPASLEFLPVDRSGETYIRVVANVPSMPNYVEAQLLDKLDAKLRQDFGAPIGRPRPTAREEAREVPDGGVADAPDAGSGTTSATEPFIEERRPGRSAR